MSSGQPRATERNVWRNLSYLRQTGSSSEPTTVFLHGVFDSAGCWLGVMNALPDGGSRYALDFRAHGKSPLSGDTYTLASLADDVIGFIEHLGADAVQLVGHSMGGATAQLVAQARPDLVSRLVLEDPAWNMIPGTIGVGAIAPHVRARAEQFRDWTPAQILDDGLEHHPQWDELEFETWLEAKLDVDLQFMELPQDWLTDIGPEAMDAVAAGTLLVTGDIDRGAVVSPEAAAVAMERLGNHGRHVHLSDAGHNIRKDDRGGFVAALNAYLR